RDLFYVSQFRTADRAWLDGKPAMAVQHLFPRGGAFMRSRAGAEWAVLGLHEESVQTFGLGIVPPLKKNLKSEELPPDPIRGMALSPNGKEALLIVADPEPEPSCGLWDLQTKRLMRKFVLPPQCAPGRCANPIHTGDRAFVECRDPDCILVWNAATLHPIGRVDPPENLRLWSWAVSAGGRFVAALFSDGSVRVIEAGGSIKNRFEKFAERPVPIAVDAEGNAVYRGGATPAVVRSRGTISYSGDYAAFAWNADGSALAAAIGDRITLIDPTTGATVRWLGTHARANRLAFSSAGNHLISSDAAGGVNIWNLNDGTVRPHVAERLPVYATALVDDRFAVATRGVKNPIELTTYGVREAAPEPLPFRGRAINVAFSPDGAMFLATVGQKVEVWDLARLQPIASLTIAGGWSSIARAAFSPCGRYIGAGHAVFDIHNGFAARTLPFQGKEGRVCDFAFQPRGSLAAIATALGSVQIFDLDSNTLVRALPPQKGVWSLALAFSPDGRRLAVGHGTVSAGNPTKTSPVVIYDVATGAVIQTIPGFLDGAWSVAWSPDGRRLATGSGLYQHRPKLGEIKIWDTQTWELVYDLKGHRDCVWSVAFSPDGRRLASAAGSTPTTVSSDSGEFIIWDLVSGQQLLLRTRPNRAIAGAAFSANGQWFATAESDGVRLWNLAATRRTVAPLPHAARSK
ncbi:MAG TPA: WD40 repeat domain-containing protein, partial [Gemmataceae bacterium]